MTASIGYGAVRPYVVPETLEELTGPTRGQLNLPTRLDWGPPRPYSLDDRADLCLAYERVIREALHVEDLRFFLNAGLLRTVWPQLVLPPRLRRLWEQRFPLLAPQAA